MTRQMAIIRSGRALWTLWAGLGASLLPTLSFGLGLGDLEIESRLNQPLRARVEVVDVSDEEWQRIRAQIAPRTLLSEGSAHSEILATVTLKAIEAANHAHYIEIKSADPVTEPLFDLPVQIAGQSLQVVRTYSVLLDPASVDDTSPPRRVPTPVLAKSAGDVPTQAAAVPRADGRAPVMRRRHHKRHVARTHSNTTRKVASVSNTAVTSHTTSASNTPESTNPANADRASSTAAGMPATATGAVKSADRMQLEGQLTSLQQSLAQLQATIAAQDAQIARLTAQVVARNEAQSRPAPTSQVESVVTDSEASEDDVIEERPSWFHRWHLVFYWTAGVCVVLVLLAMGAAAFVRRRNEKAWREVTPRYAPEATRKEAAPQEPRSNPSAWQTSLRVAQSGMWRSPSESTLKQSAFESPMATSGSAQVKTESSVDDTVSEPASASSNAETAVATVAIEELAPDFEADLEALTASYESENLDSATTGVDAWRAQNAMLERDYLADTEALPFVLEPGNQAKSIQTGRNAPVTGNSGAQVASAERPVVAKPAEDPPAEKRGTRSSEVVEILEQSLDHEPDRVDIQLKLLEIYHHEALGNRDNFDSLLRKLAAEPQLSPAQVRHLEMLQRTLHDGKHDSDSDFVAEVAM